MHGRRALEAPLEHVSQCALAAKNEVEVQFHERDTGEDNENLLVGMRLYLPEDAEAFQKDVSDRADTGGVAGGDAIVELPESVGTFVTPRGRYAIDLYQTYMRLHGKSYQYKIMYSSIRQFFYLPKPDGVHTAIVIQLDEPVRQGKQRYRELVMQLDARDYDVPVNLPEEEMRQKFGDKFSGPTMSGKLVDVLAKVFMCITGKKVFVPGKFEAANKEHKCVKCNYKQNDGHLYPLEKSLFFIHKPPIFVRHADIQFVEFVRAEGQVTHTFDLRVQCKPVPGELTVKQYMFQGVDKREYDKLWDFIEGKQIKIKNLKGKDTTMMAAGRGGASAAEVAAALDGDSDEGGGGGGGGDDDDDDDDDSSFGGKVL